MFTRSIIVFSALVCLTGQASAELLAEYDIENNSASYIQASNEADEIVASDLTAAGVSVLTGYGSGIYVARPWAESAQRDTSCYYQWDIMAENGHAIDYDSVDLSLTRGNFQSNHGAESWQLYASTDGFASSEILLKTWDISGSDYDSIVVLLDQDISALGSQAGKVTFRCYGYNADHAGQNGDYSGLAYAHADLVGTGTNLKVYGALVPEPSTFCLLIFGPFGALLLRWCRAKRYA